MISKYSIGWVFGTISMFILGLIKNESGTNSFLISILVSLTVYVIGRVVAGILGE